MYATIGRYEGAGGSVDELVRTGRQVTSALSKLPGFISCAVVDAGDGVLTSIAVYEDQIHLEQADRLVAQWVAESLSALPRRPPLITTGEIVVQKGL